jgi:MFS family permease
VSTAATGGGRGARDERLALLAFGGGVAVALHVGKLAPAIPLLRADLGLGLVEAGFLLSLVQAAGMTLGLAAGAAVDGFGLKRSLIGGLLLAALASACGALAQSATALLVWRACEGAGFLLAVMAAPALMRRLVAPERLAPMLGVWGAYMPLATALALLLGPAVMTLAGWRAWWWLLALVCGATALVAARRLPADPPAADAAAAPWAAWRTRVARTLAQPGPWWLALGFAVYSGQWLAVIGFLPSIYRDLGVGLALAAPLTAAAALVNVAGNVGAGRLLARGVPAPRLLQAGYAAMALAAVLAFAALGQGAALRYAAVLAFSGLGGLVPATLFALSVRLAPDSQTVSTTVGFMQQWSAAGQFFGPPLVAAVAAANGGFERTWLVSLACCGIGLALAAAIGRRLRVSAAAA